MSTKSKKEEVDANKDEIVKGETSSKKCQEFEGAASGEEIDANKDGLVEKDANSKKCQEFEDKASGEIKESPERKSTEKGREYKRELLDTKRKKCSSNLRKQLDKIKELLDCDQPAWVSLQLARDNLDKIKEEFNDAHREFHEFLDSEEERESSYRWFDLQDRESMDTRIKLVDTIYSEERKVEKSKPKSALSDESRTTKRSKQSNTSRASARSRRIEAAAGKAKLEVEKQFLEQEHEMRKLQLLKEISVAEAEENAMKRILNEDNDDHKTDSHTNRKPPIDTVKEDDCKDNLSGDKFTYQEKGKQPIMMNPYSLPFLTKLDPSQVEPSTSAELQPNIKIRQSEETNSLNESTIKELIKLQERQTELSAAIANQQRINSLPVQEPPVFSGNVMEYPTFIQAFETIIESKVEAS